jgi:hypothetical protein
LLWLCAQWPFGSIWQGAIDTANRLLLWLLLLCTVQVGVFTGYSALAVALALPPDGQLVAFDRDAKTMAVAMKHWQLAGVQDKV